MLHIRRIADKMEIPEEFLEYYGRHTAKLRLDLLGRGAARGKLILVTAITPTSHGEGKTVVSIGLTQALCRLGKSAAVTLREPSLGPVFGLKGGATGGGQSQVLPAEMINLHFNGDFHAVTSAHNLLAAIVDSHLHHGNDLAIDVDNIWWPRTMDMNDRSLRHVIAGLGGKANGVPRETGFVITAASEIMAILAMASSREDLRGRLSEVVIGLDLKGDVIPARSLNATGAMMVLLNEAIMPNLVQTTEGAPAIVHAGPFANIAHGTSSVLAQSMGLRLTDFVVNECGFGADLGAEKYFDLVMPAAGIEPSLTVLVASARALCTQGTGNPAGPFDLASLRAGMCNLQRHIRNLKKFRVPVVVAINRFPGDDETLLNEIGAFCRADGVESAIIDVFNQGGAGALNLGEIVISLLAQRAPGRPESLYDSSQSLSRKVETVAREIYGAGSVYMESAARSKLDRFTRIGFGHLPVCIAKTQSSFTDNPKLFGAPEGWPFTVTDAILSAGAGWVVIVAGNMMRMPGMGKSPQAFALDVDADGNITGLR